jgi:hypothetical protein
MLKVPKSPELLLPKPKRRDKRETFWRKEHEYLYGQEAYLERRLQIYRRTGGMAHVQMDGSVNDYKAGICEGCENPHFVAWSEGEWHHNVKSYGGRRCDCAACGLWVCKAWHQAHHNRKVKWSKPCQKS